MEMSFVGLPYSDKVVGVVGVDGRRSCSTQEPNRLWLRSRLRPEVNYGRRQEETRGYGSTGRHAGPYGDRRTRGQTRRASSRYQQGRGRKEKGQVASSNQLGASAVHR